MKKLITLLFILAFAIAGFTQEVKTEYKATSSTAFGKYMKAPIQVYLADSAKTYLLKIDQTRHRNMSNVFAQGATYYGQVTGGATLEAEVQALLDSVAIHRAELDSLGLELDTAYLEIDTNLFYIDVLNTRASSSLDTNDFGLYPIIKYPLMTSAVYDFAVNGGVQSTITLYGDTAFLPDNAIILWVMQDIITAPTSAGDNATIKFILNTDGDLTLNVLANGAASGQLWGIPNTYELDGNALTAANMGIAIDATFIKTTAARSIDVTIGTAAVTAGKIRIWIWYVVSE